MLNTETKQSIFAIAGMHRSGTSLTAALLQSAGVDIGQRLMGPDHVNLKGHFENLDFVEFHQMVLHSQGINDAGWTLQEKIGVEEQYVEKAKEIISKNSLNPIWGWKDPRTTLFLKFWANLLPNANFLLIYRSPWEVVDSLYRRGDSMFRSSPDLAVKIWIRYNQELLKFYDEVSSRCFLFSVYSLAQKTQSFINAVNEKFEVNLVTPASEIYDQALLHTNLSSLHRPTLVGHYFPQALDIYGELNKREVKFDETLDQSCIEKIKNSPYRVWAFQDWVDIRNLEKQGKSLQSELGKLQAQLGQTQTEKEQSQAQLQHTQAELERSQTQLGQTQTELERLQAQLQHTQAELERSQTQLGQTQAELERERSQLGQTQTELERLQAQLGQTQAELERLQAQLGQTQTELERSQAQLGQTQIEKERLQARLQHTQAELERERSQLGQTQTELERLQYRLQRTQADWEQSQAIISGMESSKFWKLRTGWFRLKRTIGITDSSSPTSFAGSFSPQTPDSPELVAIPGVNNVREIINLKAASKNYSSGYFDRINGSNATKIEVPMATTLTASGWAILAEEGRPADSVIITYGDNNSLVAVAPVNFERPDVVKNLKNPAYSNCGWNTSFNSSTLPAGKIVLKAWAYNSARKEATQLNCTPTIEVLPAVSQNDNLYYRWLSKNFPREADLRKMAETVEIFSYKPVISVIMPVFNPPEQFLREAIESVLNQVYPYWELCIADDASTKSYIRSVLEEYISKDARIKVVFRNENGHISRASNSAIEIATGEFVTLLDHDDLLTPDALYEVALLLNRHPDADMIYSDEDKVDKHNQLRDPFFKPDWCPDSFLSRMYTCHLGTYRRSLVTEIGGFRAGYEGSQDYDFVLRLTEKTEKIFHIPKILYHWRIHPASTASSLDSKNYAIDAAKKALSEAINRRGEPGVVTPAPGPIGYYLIRYHIDTCDLVSIIIPTKNLGDTVDKCLLSIFEKTTYSNYEVILIDNGSTEKATIDVIKKWKEREPNRFRCYPLDIPFNFSKINNFGVKHSKGKYLLFLNNDTEVVTPDWIEAMLEQSQRSSIGAVGALLLYPDDTIQHAGVVAGIGGVANHSHKHFKVGSSGYFNHINTVNNFSAVTAACLMCRRDVFEEVGGFEEELAVAFNDVDFCFKLVEKGYRNIYLPHVVLYHYESKSRGSENTAEKQERFKKEVECMENKWKKIIKDDPCYNPNLTRKHEDYRIEI